MCCVAQNALGAQMVAVHHVGSIAAESVFPTAVTTTTTTTAAAPPKRYYYIQMEINLYLFHGDELHKHSHTMACTTSENVCQSMIQKSVFARFHI